ncbi:MAG: acyl carrier protein [bacterium]
MSRQVMAEVKEVISKSVRAGLVAEAMSDDFKLAGNILDSMAVTNLILALEEHFGVNFEDEELSAEAFETVASLSNLVAQKL